MTGTLWKVFATITLALPGATPAAAQDDLVFSIRHTEDCLAIAGQGGDRRACIGESANRCMEANQSGSSTVGMGGCISMELGWWDAMLNAEYKALMKREKADDKEYGGDGIPSKADALRQMQRAWIGFRDATCDYERSQWGGGTGGGPATIGCHMRLTAEQALYLGDMRTMY